MNPHELSMLIQGKAPQRVKVMGAVPSRSLLQQRICRQTFLFQVKISELQRFSGSVTIRHYQSPPSLLFNVAMLFYFWPTCSIWFGWSHTGVSLNLCSLSFLSVWRLAISSNCFFLSGLTSDIHYFTMFLVYPNHGLKACENHKSQRIISENHKYSEMIRSSRVEWLQMICKWFTISFARRHYGRATTALPVPCCVLALDLHRSAPSHSRASRSPRTVTTWDEFDLLGSHWLFDTFCKKSTSVSELDHELGDVDQRHQDTQGTLCKHGTLTFTHTFTPSIAASATTVRKVEVFGPATPFLRQVGCLSEVLEDCKLEAPVLSPNGGAFSQAKSNTQCVRSSCDAATPQMQVTVYSFWLSNHLWFKTNYIIYTLIYIKLKSYEHLENVHAL